MQSQTFDVVVVGAGPSGLTAALYLAMHGVRVGILDKNEHRASQSRAIGIQAGTLELLESAFCSALSREMVDGGIPCRCIRFHLDGREVDVDLAQIPSLYNFVLLLDQSETERILESWLAVQGVRVHRGHKLVHLKQEAPGEPGLPAVSLRVSAPDGEMQTWHTRYVVGCDGAQSTTRELAGLKFEGGTYEGSLVLADVRVSWPWDQESIRTFVSSAGVAAFFPLPGEYRFRLVLVPKVHAPDAGSLTDIVQLQREAGPFLPGGISVSEPSWMTRFQVHHRLASNFQCGHVFLAGDAAHIHSPIGAQGMNTGMHDAINLGHKLVHVLKGKKPHESLIAYEQERRPIARQVLKYTDLAFRMAQMRENPVVRLSRQSAFPALAGNPWLQRQVLRAMSEVEIARKEIHRLQNHVHSTPQSRA